MQIQSLTTPTSRLMCCQSAANDTDYIPQNPLPSVFLVEQGVEYNQFGFLLDCVPAKLCAHPWPICCGGQSGERKCCSAVAKTPVCCQRCCGHKSKTQHPL